MTDGVNDWEEPVKITSEKEKKELARQRITSELEGNPNIPKKKVRKLRFKPPTKEELERMEKLDYLGNPKKGWKWEGNKIVEDTDYQMLTTKGVRLDPKRLVEDKFGNIISEDGKKTYRLKD